MTVIRGISIDAYHAHKAITNTRLKVFRSSPLLYHKVYNLGTVAMPDKACYRKGRAIDSLLFDGRDAYAANYIVEPATYPGEDEKPKPWTNAANYCKAWRRAQELYGKTILTSAQAVACEQMLQAITHHPLAIALLGQGEAQVTFRRQSERFGLELQVRPDWFSEKPLHVQDEHGRVVISSEGRPYIVDLKSIANFGELFDQLDPESPRNGQPVHKMAYHRQAGMAQWVVHKDVGETAHFLMFAEGVEPFRVAVVRLDGDYLDLGWSDVEADITRMRQCVDTGIWPGSPTRVISLSPPQWLLDKGVRETVAAVEAGLTTQALESA